MRSASKYVAVVLGLLIILTACLSIAADPPTARGARSLRELHRHRATAPAPAPSPSPIHFTAAPAPGPRARWKVKLDHLIPKDLMSVQVVFNRTRLYAHAGKNRRPPASNEKLLLTMALFDKLGPNKKITTEAAARRFKHGVVRGNLYIKGRGDPSLTKGGPHAASLPFGPTRLTRLARNLKRAGVTRVAGDVVGSTGYFKRDWNAPGWLPGFSEIEVALPTALALNGNVYKGHFTPKPELYAAKFMRKTLMRKGIAVGGEAVTGRVRPHLHSIAEIRSRPLWMMARFMDRLSSNFFAETFGKKLGAVVRGAPGSIAKGARVVRKWVKKFGVEPKVFDASGLSFDNRLSPHDLVTLLVATETRPWADRFRRLLSGGGQGTLLHRLENVRVRAKTGTLNGVSSLSGFVWMDKTKDWAEFSIMSRGLEKSIAMEIEDKIVHVLAHRAH